MRPTFGNIAAILRSHPGAAQAERASGLTAEQAAAALLDDMSKAPTAQARDAMFSRAMAAAGIFTKGVADFDAGTEALLRDAPNRDATERQAQRLSEESNKSPQFVSAERIRHLRDIGAQSSLQQGLSDRLRSRDAHATQRDKPMLPERPEHRAWADDQRDRRSALAAAIASSDDGDHLHLRDEHASLRDSLGASWDAHEARDAERDPLTDERLRSLSDAV
ncbi:MAG: hypothetical protein QM722_15055 [Piscinibacter sp.]